MFKHAIAALCVVSTTFQLPVLAAAQAAPTFDELVSDAGAIVLTEVLETNSRWHQLPEKRIVVTDVRLRVQQVIKGRAEPIVTLTLPGGVIGDLTQHVAGMPRFMTGDTDVLFLPSRALLTSPLVGRTHGRFRVVMGHGGAGRFIANSALQPVTAVADYSKPARVASGRALTLDDFIRQITARLGR